MMSIRALNNKRVKNKRRYNKNVSIEMTNNNREESSPSPDLCNVGSDDKKVEILVEMQDVIDSVNRASSGVITNNIGPD